MDESKHSATELEVLQNGYSAKVTNECQKYNSDPRNRDKNPRDIIEEMRQNYESEISVLKKQMQQIGLQGTTSEDSLQKRCHMLEIQLRKSRNDSEAMSEQVQGLRTQLRACPDRIRQMEDENDTLRERVEDVRAINQQKQYEIDRCHEMIKNLQSKLWDQSSGHSHQEQTFIKRIIAEYDTLSNNYKTMELANVDNEKKLNEARYIIRDLTSQLKDCQVQLKLCKDENGVLKQMVSDTMFAPTIGYRSEGPAKIRSPQIYRDGDNMICGDDVTPGQRITYEETNEAHTPNIQKDISLSRKSNVQITEGNRRFSILDNDQYDKTNLNERTSSIGFNLSTRVQDIKQASGRSDYDRTQRDVLQTRESLKKSHIGFHDSCVDDESDLLRRYEQLQYDKKHLEIKLSHIPITNIARYKRTNKETREGLEAQLDHIERQLGALRMTFKKKTFIR